MNSLWLPLPNARLSLQTLTFFPKSLIPFPSKWLRSSQSSLNLPFLRARHFRIHAATALLRHSEHDVVVVGAGIIGLSIARQLLLESDLSVAVVDAGFPCSGATGAGQGYIWMSHKTPGSSTWELAMRSKHLWEELAKSVCRRGFDPLQVLGWKKTGSLLIGRTLKELAILEERVILFSQAGLRAEFLSLNSLLSMEPALQVGKEGGGAFFPDDCQIDAFQAASFIEMGNKCFTSEGRYTEFYNDPAICLLRSEKNEVAEAIQTSRNILQFKKALVIAAGAWSGSLMRSLFNETDIVPDLPVIPRKGHLIVLENLSGIQLNHGLMEVGYIDHQFASSQPFEKTQDFSSVSMTATTDKNGNLVLGSSRQFSGFSKEIEEPIVKSILERASEFLPALNDLLLKRNEKMIRVGFRPYMPDGKPVIGPVPSLPKVIIATGHEGSGLSMALGTAEMVVDMILANPTRVDCTPFSVEGRFGF